MSPRELHHTPQWYRTRPWTICGHLREGNTLKFSPTWTTKGWTVPCGSQAPPGSQSRARKGLPASNSTGDTEGQRPHQGAGNSRNVHSPAGPAEPPGTGRWVARTAAPPHQAPLAHRAHSFPLTVMGTEEPALPGAPRTHTAGAPLAVTPAPCPRLQTLTLCPGASVQGQAPPGATAFHPTQGLCRGLCFRELHPGGLPARPCHHRTVYASSRWVGPST